MMATSEDRHEDPPPRPKTAALSVLLGIVAVCFAANDLLAARALRAWLPLAVLAMNLLVVGAIWGVSKRKPSRATTIPISLLLGFVALMGFGATASVARVVVVTKTLSTPWTWRTWLTLFTLASNLLIGICAIWGFVLLEPWKEWKASHEPVSPATRRANKLFGLKELLALLAVLVLLYGVHDPGKVFSNSPLSPGIAIVAIASWLLARLIREYWHYRTDEHEERAIDFGRRIGAGVFLAVTPAWWVAARADLLPQPNAMILWLVTMFVTSVGWSWHRSR
jgi:hypothetical protein